MEKTDSEWLKAAAEFGAGIAILGQNPWETLISFIIFEFSVVLMSKKTNPGLFLSLILILIIVCVFPMDDSHLFSYGEERIPQDKIKSLVGTE